MGTDFSEADIDINDGNEEATVAPDAQIPTSPDLVSPSTSPMCQRGFQACGGLLAGNWIVEETCNSETRNRKALQIWGQTFMNLATSACSDAVQSVRSRWEGELTFQKGVAIDTRLRHDMIEMNLSRSCLNATFGVNIDADKMPSVCILLSQESTSCTAVGGMCACSSRREMALNRSGVYGVLGTSVAIGTTPGNPPDFFEYCVEGDRLLWREPTSARFVVLRREGAAPVLTDPPYVR